MIRGEDVAAHFKRRPCAVRACPEHRDRAHDRWPAWSPRLAPLGAARVRKGKALLAARALRAAGRKVVAVV